ncbi:hypothetical protein WDZ92_47115, partial [Nostoc sp. NIES-2111]
MIYLKPPNFVYHNHDVEKLYDMETNYTGSSKTKFADLVTRILSAAMQTGYLRNVVINSHGYPGGIRIGDESIIYEDLARMVVLRGRVKNIWLTTC